MTLQNLNQKLRGLLHEEDGQTTTEYILMLLVAVTVIMQFKKRLGLVVAALFGQLDVKMGKVGEDMDF